MSMQSEELLHTRAHGALAEIHGDVFRKTACDSVEDLYGTELLYPQFWSADGHHAVRLIGWGYKDIGVEVRPIFEKTMFVPILGNTALGTECLRVRILNGVAHQESYLGNAEEGDFSELVELPLETVVFLHDVMRGMEYAPPVKALPTTYLAHVA